MDGRVWEALHVGHAIDLSADFDLVHNQLDWLPLAFPGQWRAPMVTTIHGFSGAGILPAYERGASAFVSISDADRSPALDYLATVHHGIDMSEFDVMAAPGDHLAVFGRIHPDKGIADAIEIARLADRRLVICGIVQDASYFARAYRTRPRRRPRRLPRFRRARGARRDPGSRGRAPASRPLRRAVRPLGRGVHGVRHPRRRVPARIDAGDHRRRDHRFRGRRSSRSGRRRAARRGAGPRTRSVARAGALRRRANGRWVCRGLPDSPRAVDFATGDEMKVGAQ